MTNSVDKVENGHRIADNIRKILLNCDLRVVYAEGELRLAKEDQRLYAKIGGQKNIRKSIRAKARYETYKVYIDAVTRIKKEIAFGLDAVLSRYTPKYKKIWTMYFIEQASIDEICSAVNYSRGNVNVIIKKLKLELNRYYGELNYAKR